MGLSDEDTVEIPPTAPKEDDVCADLILESDIEIAAMTHTGLVRAANEDHYAVIKKGPGLPL